LASSDKTNESAGASKVTKWHCVQKEKKSCEMRQVESTTFYQRRIHGEIRTEVCKIAVGAFVLAFVVGSSFEFVDSRYEFGYVAK
jgi:hypothetical protein